MGILIGIAILFIILFVLGVSREIIVFIALSMLLLFSVVCAIFFVVSFIMFLRAKKTEGVFAGLTYHGDIMGTKANKSATAYESISTSGFAANSDFATNSGFTTASDFAFASDENSSDKAHEKDAENRRNKMTFASYIIEGVMVRNLFPTDDIMERFYKKGEMVRLRSCTVKKRIYAVDKLTGWIIFIGLPVFCGLSVILALLVLQYSYIGR